MKRFLLFIIYFFASMTVFSDDYYFEKKVGDSFSLEAPSPLSGLYPNYTELSYAIWNYDSQYLNDNGGTEVRRFTIKDGAEGQSLYISCEAVWDIPYNKRPTPYGGAQHERKTWIVKVVGNDPVPDNNFVEGEYYTLSSGEGIPMTFVIGGSMNSKRTIGHVGLIYHNGAGVISTDISGRVTIPEIIPGTQGCKVRYKNGDVYTFSGGLSPVYIGSWSFYNCSKMTEIIIHSSIMSIKDGPFSGCKGLECVRIYATTPPTLNSKSVFPSSVYNTAKLIVPQGCKSKYRNAEFWSQFVNIYEEGESTEYKDGDIFTANTKEGVKMYFQVIDAANKTCRVGQYVDDTWWSCIDSDTNGKVTIPDKVNGYNIIEIASRAFENCSLVSTFTIPNTVKTIGDYAFRSCSNITSITLPNSLVTIGQEAFEHCQGLTSISIPKSVTSIGYSAFRYSGITSLYITDITAWLRVSIGNNSPYTGSEPWNKSLRLYLNNKEVKDLVIPSSITSINDFAFYNISSLTSVTIPNSVKSIGYHAFYNLEGLKEIRSEIQEPFDIDAFDSQTYSQAKLYVPDGTKLKYKKRAGWTKFNNIIDNSVEKSIVTNLSSPIKQLAAGRIHSLALTEDGTLWGWGGNDKGQIGISGDVLFEKPTKVTTNVASVATNYDHTLIVKKDGTLWACGDNTYGQFGNGKKESSNVPVKITDNVKAVATGYQHSLVLKNDGTVWTCGWNGQGQLGTEDTGNRQDLTKVADNVKSIGAGAYSTYIVKNDGTLWGCGENDHGQLADKTTEDRKEFVRIIDNVSYVASKLGSQLLVVMFDGTLWSAGYNHKGQLGNGSTTDRNELKQITTNVVSAQGTWFTSIVLKKDGTLWCCGNNQYGNLGDGTTQNTLSLKSITDNVVSAVPGIGHTLVLKSDGSLWSCGTNWSAQLGDGTLTDRLSLIKVIDAPTGTNPTQVSDSYMYIDNNSIYSLSGQRLDAPRKGINIINGKKVVIK